MQGSGEDAMPVMAKEQSKNLVTAPLGKGEAVSHKSFWAEGQSQVLKSKYDGDETAVHWHKKSESMTPPMKMRTMNLALSCAQAAWAGPPPPTS